jgi:hypothetical protein
MVTAHQPRPAAGENVNAMATCCHAAAGMPSVELQREALRTYGGRCLTPGIATRLDTALHLGRLRQDPSDCMLVAA